MAASIYDTVTDMVITAIESGWVDGNHWVRPWSVSGVGPTNPVTGKQYNGVNRFIMMMLGITYAAGYGQWKKVGGQVRKGSKGVVIAVPCFVKDENDPTEQVLVGFTGRKTFPAYTVDGWEAPQTNTVPSFARDAAVEAFIEASGASVSYGGDHAVYSHNTDQITMPTAGQFNSHEDYYGTILHELIHWTGNDSRLDRRRKHMKEHTTLADAYAFEELVAELGASFLCADLGVHPGFRQDHCEYIAHWLKQMRGDNRAIFKAAGQAQAAVTYLHKLANGEAEQTEAA